MEPIPKPLLRRLVLTFLAGGGCFLIGLVTAEACPFDKTNLSLVSIWISSGLYRI